LPFVQLVREETPSVPLITGTHHDLAACFAPILPNNLVFIKAGHFVMQTSGCRHVERSLHRANNGLSGLFFWMNASKRQIFLLNLAARGLYGSFS
jgi:hypothetical protein